MDREVVVSAEDSTLRDKRTQCADCSPRTSSAALHGDMRVLSGLFLLLFFLSVPPHLSGKL